MSFFQTVGLGVAEASGVGVRDVAADLVPGGNLIKNLSDTLLGGVGDIVGNLFGGGPGQQTVANRRRRIQAEIAPLGKRAVQTGVIQKGDLDNMLRKLNSLAGKGSTEQFWPQFDQVKAALSALVPAVQASGVSGIGGAISRAVRSQTNGTTSPLPTSAGGRPAGVFSQSGTGVTSGNSMILILVVGVIALMVLK